MSGVHNGVTPRGGGGHEHAWLCGRDERGVRKRERSGDGRVFAVWSAQTCSGPLGRGKKRGEAWGLAVDIMVVDIPNSNP